MVCEGERRNKQAAQLLRLMAGNWNIDGAKLLDILEGDKQDCECMQAKSSPNT